MKRLLTTFIVLAAFNRGAQAQGFIGASVADIQHKARPDSVRLHEAGNYGVTYYVESADENHHSVYHVTSFEKDGICTGCEYLAPLAEKTTLTEWLNRFYIKTGKDTWRSHKGIVLSLATEDGTKVRLTESKPVIKKPMPKK